jgi:hypothetical protein
MTRPGIADQSRQARLGGAHESFIQRLENPCRALGEIGKQPGALWPREGADRGDVFLAVGMQVQHRIVPEMPRQNIEFLQMHMRVQAGSRAGKNIVEDAA